MRKLLLSFLVVAVAGIGWWLYSRRSALPEIPFAKVKREPLVSTLSTNGKVEPVEWVAVYAQNPGLAEAVHVRDGQQVPNGALLVELDASQARADLASAEARVKGARAELEMVELGGRAVELAGIDSDLALATGTLRAAEREHAALERLLRKQAASRLEVEQAAERVVQARLRIEALEKRRSVLVTQTDRTVALARLQEAEAAAKMASRRIELAKIHAPIGGFAYEVAVRRGSYLNTGDLVAKIGRTGKVRVIVYVDEPELGRVPVGAPVRITWEAVHGREWAGVVERMPSQIVLLGTRQVGEVVCVIDNPDGGLLPGANINAEIRSAAVEDAVTIPREALRRESGQDGVFVLNDGKIEWRRVQLGISSVTRSQVVQGVAEGDSVALPTERTLAEGMTVRPVYP